MDENEKLMTSPQMLSCAFLRPTLRRPQSCDRFIPIRRKLNCDVLCQSLIDTSPVKSMNSPESSTASSSPSASPSTSPSADPSSAASPTFVSKFPAQEQFSPGASALTYRQQLGRAMEQTPRQRIFSFSLSETPSGPCLDRYPWNVTHTSTFSPFSRAKQSRKFPHDPERVLSIPHIRDDFYSSVMDWGSKDYLALALGSRTYLCNLGLGSGSNIENSKISSGETQHRPSSVKWSKDGRVLAIGDTQGLVRFVESSNVDSGDGQSYQMCSSHIGCLEWSGSVLYCGSRDRNIYVIDTRSLPRGQGLLRSRRASAVTSLRLSPDETLLACGCEDGVIRLWCSRTYSIIKEIVAHRSSIKALAWCPWNSSYLASGGGCNDGRIILWNINNYNGQPVSVQDTFMQTLDLVWSLEYKELISCHGNPGNSILIWSAKDLTLSLQNTLTAHQARPLHLALSPDKTTLASAGADETLCLWKLFPVRKTRDLRSSPVDLFGLR